MTLFSRILNYLIRIAARILGTEMQISYLRRQGMKIGNHCIIHNLSFSSEAYLIEIGDHVAIAGDVLFITHDGGLWCFSETNYEYDLFGKIKIGNNVHIGMRCTILPNTTIGNNCIIGAGSVVRGTFPDNSVIVGNPAVRLTDMDVLSFVYKQTPGRLRTAKLTPKQKESVIKNHFNLK